MGGTLASANSERGTFRVGGGDTSSHSPVETARLGLVVRWAKFLSHHAELGLGLDLRLTDTELSVAEQSLGVAPFLRLRLPLGPAGAEEAELYVLGSAGLVGALVDPEGLAGDVERLGGGWTAGWAVGGQLDAGDQLALFADVGMQLVNISHGLNSVESVPVKSGVYDRRRTELTVTVGAAWTP